MAVVRVYRSGSLGDPAHLLRRCDVVVGTGYASTEEAIAHAGLGQAESCDVEIRWGRDRQELRNVLANQQLEVVVTADKDK